MNMKEGEKINNLVLIKKLGMKNGKSYGLFLCDCGNTKEIRIDHVASKTTKACGCLSGKPTYGNLKHGISKTRPYHIWEKMKQRCNNKNYHEFYLYGGRGIQICEEWKDPKVFYDWAMNHGYEDGLTLDRIDCNGNYEPGNCRWATPKEQANNKRNNIRITLNGKTKTLAQWCEYFNVPYSRMQSRLSKGCKKEDLFKEYE